jgi:hypothetical protein
MVIVAAGEPAGAAPCCAIAAVETSKESVKAAMTDDRCMLEIMEGSPTVT